MARTAALLFVSMCAAMSVCAAQDTTAFTENFEVQPLDGWMLEGASVQPAGQGSALVFGGPGIAMRPATCGQSFTLTCRVRVQGGTANIVFCISGDEQQVREYQLTLGEEEGALVRHAAGASQELGAGGTRLTGKEWAKLSISRNAGQIQVSLDDQPFITAQDAQPLPAGGLAFGCHQGSGVSFDDISLSGGFGQVVQPAVQPEIGGQPQPEREVAGQAGGGGAMEVQPGVETGGPRQVDIAPGALDDLAAQPLAPPMAQLMARPVTRGDVIQALMADPRTAAQLRTIPAVGNRSLQELASTGLSGNPVKRVDLASPGAGGPGSGVAQLAQESVIAVWERGVSFTPATAHVTTQVGGQNVWLGLLRVGWMTLFQDLSELLAQNSVPIPCQGNHMNRGVADVGLWLPGGSASYMVAVKVADYSSSPASWVKGSPPIVQVRTWSQTPVQLVPLPDGSGYAGLCTIDAKFDALKVGGIADSMVQNNGKFYLDINLTSDARDQVPYGDLPSFYVWFGGFTVTRL